VIDLYGVLGVTPNASQEDIKRAGKQRRRETHPDVGGDQEAFIAVGRALAVLSDPEARQRYDTTGDAEPRSTENEIQSNAMSYLNGLAIQLVEGDVADSMVHDVIGTMRDIATAARQGELTKIASLDRTIRKVERNKDKFRRINGQVNFLKFALEKRLGELRKMMIAVERGRDMFDKAIDLLVSYRFDRDDPMPWGVSNATTSTNQPPQWATGASPGVDLGVRPARSPRQ
jgi:curved DNA-binding protein CbpA